MHPITIRHDQIDYSFYQMTPGNLGDAKVILIGHIETRSDHFVSIAALLNEIATERDLFLIEYVDRGEVAQRPVRLLSLLEAYGLKKRNIIMKGWDRTDKRDQIVQMIRGFIPYNMKIYVEERMDSMVQAIEDDYSRYERIFVIAGVNYFCVTPSPSVPMNEKVLVGLTFAKFRQKLSEQLKDKKTITLVPVDRQHYEGMGDLSLTDPKPQNTRPPSQILLHICCVATLVLAVCAFNKFALR